MVCAIPQVPLTFLPTWTLPAFACEPPAAGKLVAPGKPTKSHGAPPRKLVATASPLVPSPYLASYDQLPLVLLLNTYAPVVAPATTKSSGTIAFPNATTRPTDSFATVLDGSAARSSQTTVPVGPARVDRIHTRPEPLG